jgi:hypothetical protein
MTNQEHKKLIQNPVLEEQHHANAFTSPYVSKIAQIPFIQITDKDELKEIDKTAYQNDYAGYWAIHTNKLWTITSICILYLSLKLFGM